MQNVLRLSRTVAHFTPAQLGQKVNYRIKKFCFEKHLIDQRKKLKQLETFPLKFISSYTCAAKLKGNTFSFLNQSKDFQDDINWNYKSNGILWNLLLNSFLYLNTSDIDPDDGLKVVRSFIKNFETNKTRYDSYSISQRIINIIKFCSRFNIKDQEISEFIYCHCLYLKKNPELHLRNNHLLDNGFALLYASLFFREKIFFDTAEKILSRNIPKQILPDGAHFELSPMYHLLMVQRMLDSVSLLKESSFSSDNLSDIIKNVLPRMIGWLQQMEMKNGCLPSFNDSAEGYGPTLKDILKTAAIIKTDPVPVVLKESGFRKLKNRNFEMVIDVNGLSPAEAPGHSHADTFHFVLNVFGDPFIVDTGASTYTKGKERAYERSTIAHNTVSVKNKSQSELYDSFRVGRRAKVLKLQESKNEIEATHDGYAHYGIYHTRKFILQVDSIEIIDTIESSKPVSCKAYLHIDKKAGVKKKNEYYISRFSRIDFENHSSAAVSESWHSPSFGVKAPCYVITADFQKKLVTKIKLNK